MENNILYEDFEGFRITSERFYAQDKVYTIDEIKEINLKRKAPAKRLSIIVFSLGLLLTFLGSVDFINKVEFELPLINYIIDSNTLILILGLIIVAWSITKMLISKDLYAVEIITQSGEKEKIVSESRKYSARIMASLKRAYYRQKASENTSDDLISF